MLDLLLRKPLPFSVFFFLNSPCQTCSLAALRFTASLFPYLFASSRKPPSPPFMFTFSLPLSSYRPLPLFSDCLHFFLNSLPSRSSKTSLPSIPSLSLTLAPLLNTHSLSLSLHPYFYSFLRAISPFNHEILLDPFPSHARFCKAPFTDKLSTFFSPLPLRSE